MPVSLTFSLLVAVQEAAVDTTVVAAVVEPVDI